MQRRTIVYALIAGIIFLTFVGCAVSYFAPVVEAETAVSTVQSAAPTDGISDPTLVLNPAPLARPVVGERISDPTFGTTIRRLTNAGGDGSGFGTHIYSQLQAFSADNRYLLLVEDEGYLVRRLDSLALVSGLNSSGWNAPRWHPTLPNVVVHFDSNEDTVLRLQFTNVETKQTETGFTFPAGYERIRSNQSFDELSRNGRFLAGMASHSNGDQIIFVVDLEQQALGAELALSADLYGGACAPDPQWGEVEPDWIGVSPLGNYLVVQWVRDGTTRCSGLETFHLQSGAFVGRVYDGHQHGDLGVMPDGTTEFFMTFELYHPSGNLSLGTRTLPGNATVQEPTYVQVLDWVGDHISCQGLIGVCLVTTRSESGNGHQPLEGELFLQYTDGRVERLVHHRSSGCGYWVQPRASLSRDGRFVIFASDWGQPNCSGSTALGDGDAFLLELDGSGGTPPPIFTPTAFSYLPFVFD